MSVFRLLVAWTGRSLNVTFRFPDNMLKYFSLFVACVLAFTGTVAVANAQQRLSSEESERVTVVLRCSYASPESSKNTEPLFYKVGREYKPFSITVMAFVRAYEYRGPLPFVLYRKASEQEVLQRKEQGVRGADLEYIPYTQINIPAGLRDVGILIPGSLKGSKPVVFDFNETLFPVGSMMVINMTKTPIQFGLAQKVKKDEPATMAPQVAELPSGGRWITKPVKTRTILNIRAAVPDKSQASGWKTVYANSGTFREMTRSVLFVVPSQKLGDDGTPRLDFRQANVVPKPPPKEDDAKKPGEKRKGDKKDEKKSGRRRV